MKPAPARNHGGAVLLVTGLGSFMTALNSAVVFIIVPIVQQDFSTSVVAVQWVTLAFHLTVTGLLLPFGRLGDLYGLRRVYLVGFLIFGVASFFCALSPAISYLIGFRILQAMGTAMVLAASPALLTLSFPPERCGRVLGLQLTLTYLGLTVGPIFGGFVAGWWNWRGVFWINIPFSLLMLYLSLRVLPRTAISPPRRRFDLGGAGFFLVAVAFFMLGVTGFGREGSDPSRWSVLRSGLMAIGAILGFAFVLQERRLERVQAQPMLSLALFTTRPFLIASVISLIGYTCEFFVTFLMPFYLLQILVMSPAQAGLLLMVKSVMMMAVAPFAGDCSDRVGPRLLSVTSMVAFAGTFWLQSRLNETSGVGEILLALTITGLATGLFVAPNNSVMMGSARAEMKGMASAVLGLMRNFGMVWGTALSGALLTVLPRSLLDGYHLAVRVGMLIALVGLGVALIQGRNRSN